MELILKCGRQTIHKQISIVCHVVTSARKKNKLLQGKRVMTADAILKGKNSLIK